MATHQTFDFAILGDIEPEGLICGTALARKGFSVIIVPSSQLEEWPQISARPLELPQQVGSRRLDDLLFRAGFFRLEEAGLVPLSRSRQVLLPKCRLSIEPEPDRFRRDLIREFPLVGEQVLKTLTSQQPLAKKVSELEQYCLREPLLKAWILGDVEGLIPLQGVDFRFALKAWLELEMPSPVKSYAVDTRLKMPYQQFLVEHARKWGVKVLDEPLEFKSEWRAFTLNKQTRARDLIINSLGGLRFLAKRNPKVALEGFDYWLYWDRWECELGLIPEPFQEEAWFEGPMKDDFSPTRRRLTVKRDEVRGLAEISLGTWLPFNDSKAWVSEVEQSRKLALKFFPFMPSNCLRPIPSLLDLNEAKGDCIRYGQFDRLIPKTKHQPGWKSILKGLVRKSRAAKARPSRVSRHIYSVSAISLSMRHRKKTFEECFQVLDFFEAATRTLKSARSRL